MRTNEHYGIGINTAKGAIIIFFGAICFASGYYNGWEDRAAKLSPATASEQSKSESNKALDKKTFKAPLETTPSIKPLQSRPTLLPPNHPPIPESDEHGHPSFDCRALQATVTQGEGVASINQLFSNRKDKAGDQVALKAIVVGAYYKILGTNWYHLCDAPSGQVLVVSSNQLVEQRSLIEVKGKLSVDFDLSGVYRFPLYIKDAALSGKGVKAGPEPTPEGVIKL